MSAGYQGLSVDAAQLPPLPGRPDHPHPKGEMVGAAEVRNMALCTARYGALYHVMSLYCASHDGAVHCTTHGALQHGRRCMMHILLPLLFRRRHKLGRLLSLRRLPLDAVAGVATSQHSGAQKPFGTWMLPEPGTRAHGMQSDQYRDNAMQHVHRASVGTHAWIAAQGAHEFETNDSRVPTQIASFLSGLSRKKHKLKKKVEQQVRCVLHAC